MEVSGWAGVEMLICTEYRSTERVKWSRRDIGRQARKEDAGPFAYHADAAVPITFVTDISSLNARMSEGIGRGLGLGRK